MILLKVSEWPLGQAVRQWIANPPSPVRIREGPFRKKSLHSRVFMKWPGQK